MRKGDNTLRTGIAAVHARLADGRWKIIEGACPNLLYEASLYRYDTEPAERRSESPAAGPDHALDALRYLVCRLDARQMARRAAKATRAAAEAGPKTPKRPWLSVYNEQLWTRLY